MSDSIPTLWQIDVSHYTGMFRRHRKPTRAATTAAAQ